MSNAAFAVSFKSTIDYLAKQVADAKGLPFLDLASDEFDKAIVESDRTAICWDLTSLDETPFDPMYTASFEIGAMTFLDPSQYNSLGIAGAMSEVFKVTTSYEIRDYSGDTASEIVGKFFVVSCGLAPVQQDQVTNVRFVSVVVRAVRYA